MLLSRSRNLQGCPFLCGFLLLKNRFSEVFLFRPLCDHPFLLCKRRKPQLLEIPIRKTEIEGEAEAKDQPERDEGTCNDRGMKAQEDADREKNGPDICHDQVDLHEDRVIPEDLRGGFFRIMISEGVQVKEGRKQSSGEEAGVNPCDRVVLKKLSGCLTHEQEGQGHYSKISGDSPVKIAGPVPASG